MNLVADEDIDRGVVERLRRDGHAVDWIAEISPSVSDEDVLKRAAASRAVLVTGRKKRTFTILFGTIFAPHSVPANSENPRFLDLRPAACWRIMSSMAAPRSRKLLDSDIVGLKYFDRLMPLLHRLHDIGAARDHAGNRRLFFDHYCAYILLFLFNPIVTSLRGIQQASELKNVQKRLGCPRAALGSLSEATQVFDPEPVKHIASQRAGQLEPLSKDRRFPEVKPLMAPWSRPFPGSCRPPT